MYVCVFVCFATKAIHLELISDLSSDACITGIKLFIGRRGNLSKHIVTVVTTLLEQRIICHLGKQNPLVVTCGMKASTGSRSLNLHPILEAAVKSMKFHLKRVLGAQILSQEEFTTVLVEIETVLNSKPLIAASDDPDDYSVITPGHFLITSELKRLPQLDLTQHKTPIRERLKLVTQISQSFWKSWSKDYLTQLQVRNKWKTLVIIKK
ncbi:hypothetical protein AVEN_41767-1 [Araneus ventricosus]|uniref:DUF5641 domain-containing protein n=1 Tax=Araneus ventricosus TaxID=182803 RepID=A0A4Y2AEG7_ARAVE|nr:hypothetical protein AVEN_41767-1 [Araneus ventricosus]